MIYEDLEQYEAMSDKFMPDWEVRKKLVMK